MQVSRAAQQGVLDELVRLLRGVLERRRLPTDFECRPGTRLRRRYGSCQWRTDGLPPLILVRCTADGAPEVWRRRSAIVGTLVHELAHLRYRGHSKSFWRLCRSLLDDAAALGLYMASDDDPLETAQGRDKLAGSAADIVVQATRKRRAKRMRAARQLLSAWQVGDLGVVQTQRGRLARALVKVIAVRRTRLLVEAADGRRYLVSVGILEHATKSARAAS